MAKRMTGLEDHCKRLRELLDAGVEDPAEVEAQLAGVSSRLEPLEAEKRTAELRVLELEATDANWRPPLAEVETLRQRLRKTEAEIAGIKRQIAEDEKVLAEGKALPTLIEKSSKLAARTERLHRQIQETQRLETSNRQTERVLQVLESDLTANMNELQRLRVEHKELSIVPCGGNGSYASCPKIRGAVETGQKIPALEGEIATLSLEVEVQRSSLVQIATPSFELTRTLEGCERERRIVGQERERYEELRAVEARREERLKALEHLAQGRGEVAEELTRKESALSAFADLDAKMQASRREIENCGSADHLLPRQTGQSNCAPGANQTASGASGGGVESLGPGRVRTRHSDY